MQYYEIKDVDLAGRIAKLRTAHGVLETPYLLPVIDPSRQEVELDFLREHGFNAFITNAYLFYRRNKGKVRSIHQSLNWNNIIMTDSGGYQVLIYGDVEIDNKTIVDYQRHIGSDIAVILDIPTGSHMDKQEAFKSIEETFRRAVEALPIIQDSDTLWVLPIQGAPYKDLVIYSSVRAWKYPYHIHALGSPTVLLEKYEYSRLVELVALARIHLPPNRPLHVFGVGHPMIIPFLVALGADLFDSASYILYARDNRYMVSGGTKRVEELSYFPCSCPVCSKYTPQELYEMSNGNRIRLLALHNIYKLMEEINRVKQAIKEGRLWEYLESRSKEHPSLRSAFEVIKKYLWYIEKHTPYSKASPRALLLYDYDSIYNPKLKLFRENVMKYVVKVSERILLLPAVSKPYKEQAFVEKALKYMSFSYEEIFFYNPFLGIIPWGLTEIYPVFQHEEPNILFLDTRFCDKMYGSIQELINKTGVKEILIVTVDDCWWCECFTGPILERLMKQGVKVSVLRV